MGRSQIVKLMPVILGVILIVLGGCAGQSAPTRFYVLSPMPDTGMEAPDEPPEGCLAIGIGPVELPRYLDRPQIVTRVSENRLRLADFDKWAEPVMDNFTRVLAENLSELLCTEPIAIFPYRGTTPLDLRISVEVIRFDGTPGKGVQLMARWMVHDEQDRKVLVTKDLDIDEPVEGEGYEALVLGLSRTVEALSRDIAEGVKSIL